ncbi:MAG: GDSL family lipase [Ignavibacteria bacterium]|jgi:lysophospholipase L1-like esterase|nr:GDSL family lipase [Ignavibacteria bacterium]MCU7501699.1 GDSL family lipase [Ignavibacteria bacterium]MCU7516894.1 GDSL family lipase [Ignavibacteria bacterium]
MKKGNKPILLIILITFLFSASSFAYTSGSDTAAYKKNSNYWLQTGLYNIYRTQHANIVMLGNSITHGVNWNELMGRNDIAERGIPSDNVEGFLNRLDYIYKLNPRICFIMGGINDIYSGYSAEAVFSEYVQVIKGLQDHKIIPVIQSTLFVSTKWHNARDKNPEVSKLNALLKDYAEKNNLLFVDLIAKMTRDGLLRDELTYDGLHLNANGYAIWRDELDPLLNRLIQ